jgi:hypothetical protein
MKKIYVILLAALVATTALIAVGFWYKDWLAIDKCLDNGGRWDYDKRICEHGETSTKK